MYCYANNNGGVFQTSSHYLFYNKNLVDTLLESVVIVIIIAH
jgi:hypothetical protein